MTNQFRESDLVLSSEEWQLIEQRVAAFGMDG